MNKRECDPCTRTATVIAPKSAGTYLYNCAKLSCRRSEKPTVVVSTDDSLMKGVSDALRIAPAAKLG